MFDVEAERRCRLTGPAQGGTDLVLVDQTYRRWMGGEPEPLADRRQNEAGHKAGDGGDDHRLIQGPFPRVSPPAPHSRDRPERDEERADHDEVGSPLARPAIGDGGQRQTQDEVVAPEEHTRGAAAQIAYVEDLDDVVPRIQGLARRRQRSQRADGTHDGRRLGRLGSNCVQPRRRVGSHSPRRAQPWIKRQ